MKKRQVRTSERRARVKPPTDWSSLLSLDKIDEAFITSHPKAQRLGKDYNLFCNALSNRERLDLNRFLKYVALLKDDFELGDVEKAAEKAHVSMELIKRFMSVYVPIMDWSTHAIAVKVLSWAKGLAGNNWLSIAKLAAQDLKACKGFICKAADENNKRFFIDLGKCLSGEIKSPAVSKREIDLAHIICRQPTSKDEMREWKNRGWQSSKKDGGAVFRNQKKPLLDAFKAARELHEQSRKA
jgi:hypothetical protein